LTLLLGAELGTFAACFSLITDDVGGKSRENATRFLVISSVMTGIFLYGLSLCYMACGSMSFPAMRLENQEIAVIGAVLIVAWPLFKLSVAPFHTWAVDIYEDASLELVMFFDTLWKFCLLVAFARVFEAVNCTQLRAPLTLFASISMLIGSIMPIFEENIKKFIAYASTGHMGFVVTTFISNAPEQATSIAIAYSFLYALASACFFASLYETKPKVFGDIEGYGTIVPMFAMIGMPPFANFMAKLQILKSQVAGEHYVLLAISIIYSILCIVYVGQKTMKIFAGSPHSAKCNRSSTAFTVLICSLLLAGAIVYNRFV
jgi:NADH-quinone oxidoreductase subunit N